MIKKPNKKTGRKNIPPDEKWQKVLASKRRYRSKPEVKEYMRRYYKWRDSLRRMGILPLKGGFDAADEEALKNVVPFSEWVEGRPPVYDLPPTRNAYDEQQAQAAKHDPRLDYVPWQRAKPPENPTLDALKTDTYRTPAPNVRPTFNAAPGRPMGKKAPPNLKQ